MTFISYAQNYEDIMLWRALRGVEKGFYVDVGANDPTQYSITRAFYDFGWHGINIEPVYSYYTRLCAERPRDINLNVAAGVVEGQVTFYEIPDTGLSTTSSSLANQHKIDGWAAKEITVQVETLNQILEKQANDNVIHFMSIDVEGGEKDVLLGLDFSRWRPWILLIESTIPRTEIPDFQEWEDILISHEYEFVYFDALNRFYIAKEHIELAKFFNLPPNVFDEIMLASQVSDQNKIHEINVALTNAQLEHSTASAKLAETSTKWAETSTKLANALAELGELGETFARLEIERNSLLANLEAVQLERDKIKTELDNLYRSRSYRMTTPVRTVVGFIKDGRSQLKFTIKRILKWSAKQVAKRPWLKTQAVSLLNYFPGYKLRLKNLMMNTDGRHLSADYLPEYFESLSLRERQIYRDLLNVIEQKKTGK